MVSEVLILTGNLQTGKTTTLLSIIEALKSLRWKVGGISAPGYFADNLRHSFDIVDIATGERTLLSSRDIKEASVRCGPFGFHPDGLALGAKALERAISHNFDIVVVDEIGPLELRGGGWRRWVELLINSAKRLLLTVRTPCLDEIKKSFHIEKSRCYSLEEADELLRYLKYSEYII